MPPVFEVVMQGKPRYTMPDLKGSKTHDNLKTAFAGESQANRRYLYFAQKADVEGYPDVAALFRSVAEGETGHAFGHFDFLAEVGDPVTGVAKKMSFGPWMMPAYRALARRALPHDERLHLLSGEGGACCTPILLLILICLLWI